MSKGVWDREYKGLKIRSDYRVHDNISKKISKLLNTKYSDQKEVDILDIAVGSGALSQRLVDENNRINLDVNDLEDHCEITTYSQKFKVDLNKDFTHSFKKEGYDIILAVEIIEHLHDSWRFIKDLSNNLKPGGVIILSTPNSDSFLDRLIFLLHGHEFYFGNKGYYHSGGHISPVPDWKYRLICSKYNLSINERDTSVTVYPLLGVVSYVKLLLFGLVGQLFSKSNNSVSINIYQCSHLDDLSSDE